MTRTEAIAWVEFEGMLRSTENLPDNVMPKTEKMAVILALGIYRDAIIENAKRFES